MPRDALGLGPLLSAATLVALISTSAAAHAQEREYTLTVERRPVNVTGHPVTKLTVNGSIPAPELRFRQGDTAVIHVLNRMDVPTSLHWHGLLVPGAMDGVTGFNGYRAIPPHGEFTYRFPIRQSGTYWYHSHTAGQEQEGLYGPLVIDPPLSEPLAPTDEADRDYTVTLSDFTSETPEVVMGNLKRSSDYYAYARRTLGDFIRDVRAEGWAEAWRDRTAWGKMRMARTDLSDVSGYTYLANGEAPARALEGSSARPLRFTPGQRVRLRLINASAMTLFDVRVPGLRMAVIAADGRPVSPVTVDEFRFAPGETYDVMVVPREDRAYTVAAEAMDRSGFALAALTPRTGLTAEAPAPRPRALLTMADMNMALMMKDDPDMEMRPEDMNSGWEITGAPSGSRALRYEDLEYRGPARPAAKTSPPSRTLEIRLGGNMERYIWTLNGQKFSEAEPIILRYGERLRLTFVNETMMAHPMHLHGMFFQPENGKPLSALPDKHTLIIPPGQTRSVLLTADEPGEWAFHCHLLYHMTAGMMRMVKVSANQEHVHVAP